MSKTIRLMIMMYEEIASCAVVQLPVIREEKVPDASRGGQSRDAVGQAHVLTRLPHGRVPTG